ncbi:MAG: septal ring lytic transglycosylase RlpA family protein [bacterium]
MFSRGFPACALLGLLLLAAPAQAKLKKEVRAHFTLEQSEPPPPAELELGLSRGPREVGLVSWYGPGFHGRRTASGERYNMHAMTCASRDLPFGTLLELTNVENGEKAVVRVNDRGPFKRWRILDLSYAAAKKLGFHRSGQAKVEVREVSADELALADNP